MCGAVIFADPPLVSDRAKARERKKAFDKRHKATARASVEDAVSTGQRVYTELINVILRQVERLPYPDIAFDWSLDPKHNVPLFEHLNENSFRSRIMGSVHFWDDLRSIGFDKFEREQRIEAVFPDGVGFGGFVLSRHGWWEQPIEAADAWDSLPPEGDALFEVFAAKTPHTRATFDALGEIDKTNAFTIAGTESVDLVRAVKTLALDELSEGVGKREFIKKVKAQFEKMGVTPTSNAHLRTVYNTNVHGAYNSARFVETFQLDTPEVRAFIPYLQYSTTGAETVCPICEPYDGLIYQRDDPTVQQIYPPNHFNCACAFVPVTIDEVRSENLRPTNKNFFDDPDVPNPIDGFFQPPAQIGALDIGPSILPGG
ncbi:hypothetical protein LCGC14_1658120 [marine sediment metagenome]|uniref:Phage head morphogenesis domain-containing protein n=1 Tax=marine sediment metagenome TaxID=412755 RepID=A0A0F9KAR5_9ZZZZ